MANRRTNYRRSGQSSYSGSRSRSYRYGYQYGSVAPELYPEESERRETRRSRQEQERVARSTRNRQATHAAARNAAVVGFMLLMSALMCVLLFSYISLQSAVTQSVKEIASYESTLSSLKTANDQRYNEIVASVDLDEIKTRAMTELGMTYAAEDQIISYEADTSDYVHQVQEVTSK